MSWDRLRQQSLVRNPMFGALDNTTRYTPIVMAAEAYEIYEINFFSCNDVKL